MWPYASDLRRRGEWRRLFTEVTNYVWIRPFPWRGIRARFLKLFGKEPHRAVFPEWLAADFSKRMNLQQRWKEWGEHPNLRVGASHFTERPRLSFPATMDAYV